jgi:ATP-dependent DNA helicase RecG
MSRLLEGDVGSGKTFVAAATAFATVTTRPRNAEGKQQDFGNLQVAYMAPTEILATQHFESFIEFFKDLPIQIGLITSSGCKKFPSKVRGNTWTDISRAQLLKWAENGEIPILIGTHALIQKSVKFKHLAYVIIDEQHRFGTSQRMALARGHMRTETQTDAEKNSAENLKEKLLYKDLTYAIRDILFKIRKELGLGHKELIYQRAIEEELKQRGILFTREARIPVFYQKKQVGTYQPDFVIDEKVILELKSLPFIGQKEKKQLWTYLKGSNYSLALLANFGTSDLTIDRVIYEQARVSASSPHVSATLPHLLSMTATPIPRTLALTVYGDLDLTLLDEMPAGRKEIKTKIVTPSERKDVYAHIRELVKEGRQAYVICPRIDEPDPTKELAIRAKSVNEEAQRLQDSVFPELRIDVVHGKLKTKDKEDVMQRFTNGEIDILVATSVIEVGVNVPNATIILIEGAERFGLAQLHQLRGRVLRSTHQAFCYLFTDAKGPSTIERLEALVSAKNGFELAEHDLQLRGSGELYGKRQWGLTDVAMEALKNIKMVEAARTEAHTLIEKDPELVSHPQLKTAIAERDQIHFE